ncbi:MAG: hypothetical protein MJ252_21700, partial [archaeon]|nr:hypothetical protein [archaeon]
MNPQEEYVYEIRNTPTIEHSCSGCNSTSIHPESCRCCCHDSYIKNSDYSNQENYPLQNNYPINNPNRNYFNNQPLTYEEDDTNNITYNRPNKSFNQRPYIEQPIYDQNISNNIPMRKNKSVSRIKHSASEKSPFDLGELNTDLKNLKRKYQIQSNKNIFNRDQSNKTMPVQPFERNIFFPSKTIDYEEPNRNKFIKDKNKEAINVNKVDMEKEPTKLLLTESSSEADRTKDLLIETLKKEVVNLNNELRELRQKYSTMSNSPKRMMIEEQTDEEGNNYEEIILQQNQTLQEMQEKLERSKEDIKSLVKRNSKLMKFYEAHKYCKKNALDSQRRKLRMIRNINLVIKAD